MIEDTQNLRDQVRAQAELAKEAYEQCAREKYWSELSIEERIERTRKMVQTTRRELDELASLYDRIRNLEERFNAHTHGQNGLAVLPAPFSNGESLGGLGRGYAGKCVTERPADPDQVYF